MVLDKSFTDNMDHQQAKEFLDKIKSEISLEAKNYYYCNFGRLWEDKNIWEI